ncbi:uncharacterized protein LOC116610940 [Nematostella vectensis]|uniref:uncharacterized protein LOC116610940 n=1 Tax=Nematostella vectensis TaxID=45351 RepID=UPI0013900ADB|nr:uncharacterized protein LOC116610940 [Nematostella vectensis]
MPSIFPSRSKMGHVTACLLLLAVFQACNPYVWQTARDENKFLRIFYQELRKIPPRRVTAQKIATYFLDRDDVHIASIHRGRYANLGYLYNPMNYPLRQASSNIKVPYAFRNDHYNPLRSRIHHNVHPYSDDYYNQLRSWMRYTRNLRDPDINPDDQYNIPRRSRLRRATKRKYFYDVAFLLDTSTSVRRRNFELAKRALIEITDRGMKNTSYAAITYSKYAKLEFNFTRYPDAKDKLLNIKYRPGNTNTQEALHMALKQLFENPESNVRNDSRRRVLLVTDGLSNVRKQLTLLRAFELKASGIEVFVVAVGRYRYGMEEIVGMASSTQAHLFRVSSMNGLVKVIKLIPIVPKKARSWLTSMHSDSFRYQQQTSRNNRRLT